MYIEEKYNIRIEEVKEILMKLIINVLKSMIKIKTLY